MKMKESKTVFIGTLENAVKFVGLTDRMDADMVLKSGSTEISAKSLLGVFSMDLTRPLELVISGPSETVNLAEKTIQFFIKD